MFKEYKCPTVFCSLYGVILTWLKFNGYHFSAHPVYATVLVDAYRPYST